MWSPPKIENQDLGPTAVAEPTEWPAWMATGRHIGHRTVIRSCVLTELPDVFAVQRARRAPPLAGLLTGMSCSASGGTAESGHLMPNRSPISLSVLLVGISRNVRTAPVTCGNTRTLKFTLIVQRMPNRARRQHASLCASRHLHSPVEVPGSSGGWSSIWRLPNRSE